MTRTKLTVACVTLALTLSTGCRSEDARAESGAAQSAEAAPIAADPAPRTAEAAPPAAARPAAVPDRGASIHALAVEAIDGSKVELKAYAGKTLLIVNTASQCGYTRQYGPLEQLYRAHKDAGLVVLGFPSNDFGGQEPAPEDEIKRFCESKFDVTFPLFAKVHARGDAKADLYRLLTEQGPKKTRGDVRWNFTKFLVDGEGYVVERFESGVEPDDPKLVGAIQAQLGGKR